MSAPEVINISIKEAMELKVAGVIRSNPHSFSINVGHNRDLIALHFKPCFDVGKGTIILNSKQGGSWKEEARETVFPFQAGQEFEVSIVFNVDYCYIYLPNGHMMKFLNRMHHMKYKYIFFVGDATIQDISVKPSKR